MATQIFSMGRDELEPLLTVAMQATLEKLEKDGLLTKEQINDFAKEHGAILITKKTIVNKLRDIFYPKDSAEITENTIFVRIVSLK